MSVVPSASSACPPGSSQPEPLPEPLAEPLAESLAELATDTDAVRRFLSWMSAEGLHVCVAETGFYRSCGMSPDRLIARWTGIPPHVM